MCVFRTRAWVWFFETVSHFYSKFGGKFYACEFCEWLIHFVFIVQRSCKSHWFNSIQWPLTICICVLFIWIFAIYKSIEIAFSAMSDWLAQKSKINMHSQNDGSWQVDFVSEQRHYRHSLLISPIGLVPWNLAHDEGMKCIPSKRTHNEYRFGQTTHNAISLPHTKFFICWSVVSVKIHSKANIVQCSTKSKLSEMTKQKKTAEAQRDLLSSCHIFNRPYFTCLWFLFWLHCATREK